MADDQDKSGKTEEPTEKRLQDARRKGDVAQSRETGNLFVVLGLLGIVLYALPLKAGVIAEILSAKIAFSGQTLVGTGTAGLRDLGGHLWVFVVDLAVSISPFFAILAVGAIAGALLQGQTVLAVERMKPKLSKISLKEGIKRMFSLRSFVEFLKNLIKVFAVGALALWATNNATREIWQGVGFLPEYLPGFLLDYAAVLLTATAALLVPIAIADGLWRRYDWKKRQMMSLKEVKDEMKGSEGSPELRAKRAALRRQRSNQRIAAAVPMANLVLTNPTHFSIALKYDAATDVAPICVAKGADNIARIIRELAYEHDIPMIENKPLSRLLYEVVEVDQVVPVEHWEVLAEIISFVMELQTNQSRKPPAGSTLRQHPD